MVNKLTDTERLLIVADNLEGFWAECAAAVDASPEAYAGKTYAQLLKEDAATLREISARLDEGRPVPHHGSGPDDQ